MRNSRSLIAAFSYGGKKENEKAGFVSSQFSVICYILVNTLMFLRP